MDSNLRLTPTPTACFVSGCGSSGGLHISLNICAIITLFNVTGFKSKQWIKAVGSLVGISFHSVRSSSLWLISADQVKQMQGQKVVFDFRLQIDIALRDDLDCLAN